jgi:hypothetical protein
MKFRKVAPTLVTALGLASLGCSNSDGSQSRSEPLDEIYVLGTHVSSGDDATFYAVIVDSLDKDVDLEQAIEVNGQIVFGNDGAFFAGDNENLKITRYELDEAGNVSPSNVIGLLDLGFVPTIGVYFASPEKAYMLDGSGLRFLVWNPKTMCVAVRARIREAGRKGRWAARCHGQLRPVRQGR